MSDMAKAERFCHIYTEVEDSCATWVKGCAQSLEEAPCGVWGRAPPIQITKSEFSSAKKQRKMHLL